MLVHAARIGHYSVLHRITPENCKLNWHEPISRLFHPVAIFVLRIEHAYIDFDGAAQQEVRFEIAVVFLNPLWSKIAFTLFSIRKP